MSSTGMDAARAPDASSTQGCQPKWLSFGNDPAQGFRLPDDTNLDHVEALIKAAMRSGEPLTIDVHSGDHSRQNRVILNPHALPLVVITEMGSD